MLITIDANFIQKLPSLSTIVDQGVCALRMVWEGWFVFGIHILIKKINQKVASFGSFDMTQYMWHTLPEKCPNTELFLVRIQSVCGKIWTRNNLVFGHFSCSDILANLYIYTHLFNLVPKEIHMICIFNINIIRKSYDKLFFGKTGREMLAALTFVKL